MISAVFAYCTDETIADKTMLSIARNTSPFVCLSASYLPIRRRIPGQVSLLAVCQ